MKRLFPNLSNLLRRKSEDNSYIPSSIIGSWRLSKYTDAQDVDVKPHWKEVWSFAAMDENETDGIYVCDYINLHSIVGKWILKNNSLKLHRKESENDYYIEELSDDTLVLKPHSVNIYKSIVFQRVQ